MRELSPYLFRYIKNRRISYRYIPPQDAVDAGVVVRKSFGNKGKEAIEFADAQNKAMYAWKAERKHLKNLSTSARVLDLIKSYKESINFEKLADNTKHEYAYSLSRWLDTKVAGVPLKTAKLMDINTPMCQRLYEEHAGHSTSLANHSLAVYRLLFNYAIRHGFTQHNPFSRVLRRADKPRKVVWSREEIKKFLDVAYSSFKWRNIGLIVQMAHEWGQRMGDMRTLKWSDYNIETGVLSLEQSKRRARITIPTSQGLQEMLKQQHEDYGWQQYIAPSDIPDRQGGLKPFGKTQLSRHGDAIRTEAGISNELMLMDLRRTAVTEMIEAEVPLPNIMAMTGHATPQSVAPYLKHTLKGATVAARMRGFV